jgi:hypothetical protein
LDTPSEVFFHLFSLRLASSHHLFSVNSLRTVPNLLGSTMMAKIGESNLVLARQAIGR